MCLNVSVTIQSVLELGVKKLHNIHEFGSKKRCQVLINLELSKVHNNDIFDNEKSAQYRLIWQ